MKSDIVTELIGFPHILTDIFSGVSLETLLATEKVSPSWERILALPSIWTNIWRENTMVSLIWKRISARMEHRSPELFNRIKDNDASAYREAVNYVGKNISRIQLSLLSSFPAYCSTG